MFVRLATLGAIVLAFCGCQSVTAQRAPSFTLDGRRLTITTDRYEVVWRDGTMVACTSLLRGRQALTVPGEPMALTALPNGPGSFHGGEAVREAADKQHFVVYSHKLETGPAPYPGQHPPAPDAEIQLDDVANGVRITWRGLIGDADGILIQELTVDPTTGELIVRQAASSPNPGLYGIALCLLNLRPDIAMDIPYFGGIRQEYSAGRIVGRSWPQFWNAGMIVGELPEGGSFMVFADDPGLRHKMYKHYMGDDVQALSFESVVEWPYDDRRQIRVPTWRFNTYAGTWTEPAERYKQWLKTAYDLVPMRERPSGWTENIAMVWPRGPSIDEMRTMAERIDPEHALILNLGWAKGFNRNCPYYEPHQENLAAHLEEVHELGYRYGVYTSMKLIDKEAHPELAPRMQVPPFYYGINKPPVPYEDVKHWLLHICPQADEWIQFYSDLMAETADRYGLDLLYEDVAGGQPASPALIDGRSFHEGTVACDHALRRKRPRLGLAGEFWSEVNLAAHHEFGLTSFMAWFSEGHKEMLAKQTHPLGSYLFNDFCRFISYRTPMRAGTLFHYDCNTSETIGGLPVWRGATDDAGSEARYMLDRIRLWQEGYRPWHPDVYEENTVAYMRAPDGSTVRYVRPTWQQSFCFDDIDQLVHGRASGVHALDLDQPVHIDGWFAYDLDGPIGLDPESWYCLFPGPPRDLPVQITALPRACSLAATRSNDWYTLATLDGDQPGIVTWLTAREGGTHVSGIKRTGAMVAQYEEPGTILWTWKPVIAPPPERPLNLDMWKALRVSHGRVIGTFEHRWPQKRWTLGDTAHVAWDVMPIAGGPGTEVVLEAPIKLPDNPGVALGFAMGRLGGVGDGVHFTVRVNGREIFRHFSPSERGWTPGTVALGDFAGQTVLISLGIDSGKGTFNLSNDNGFWGNVRILAD